MAKAEKSINQQVLKGSFIALSSNLIARGSQIASRAVISRLSGPYGLGIFEIVLAFSRWVSLVGQAGMHQSTVHFVAKLRVKKSWNEVLNVFIQALLVVSATTFLLLSMVWLIKESIHSELGLEGSPSEVFLSVISLSLLLSLSNYIAFFFRGHKKMLADQLTRTLPFPCILLGTTAYYYFFDAQAFDILIVFHTVVTILSAVVILAILVALFITIKKISSFKWSWQLKPLMSYSWPIWISSILNTSRAQFSRLIIPFFSTTSELGLYGAAYSIAMMVSFINKGFAPINQSLVAEAYGQGEHTKIEKIYNNIINKTSRFIFVIMGTVICFGEMIMALIFGSKLMVPQLLLILLVASEAINALAGPSGNVLIMTGHQKKAGKIMFTGFAILAVLSIVLVPKMGALGAAIASGIAIVTINVLRVYYIKKLLNVRTQFGKIIRLNLPFIMIYTLAFIANQANLISEYVLFFAVSTISTIILAKSILYKRLKK